jgi:hypothetical protein
MIIRLAWHLVFGWGPCLKQLLEARIMWAYLYRKNELVDRMINVN